MNRDYFIKLNSDAERLRNGRRISNILRHADINELKNKIDSFQKIDIENITDKELEDSIEDILCVSLDNGKFSTNLFEYSLFDVGQRFYRVRKLDNTDIPNKALKNVAAYWNPPRKRVVNYGRLNKPKESLLYTALNPYTAICETNIKAGDPFGLFIYEAIRPLKFSWIGGNANYKFNGITNKKAIEYLELVRQFLTNEFTRIVPDDKKYLYRISQTIARNYYYMDNNGVRYPSIKNNLEDNICFYSKRLMYNVKLIGALTAIFNEENETDPHNMKMNVKYIILGPNMNNYYSYQSPEGEEYMEKLFSEFYREDNTL